MATEGSVKSILPKLPRWLSAAAALLLTAGAVSAQNPVIESVYQRIDPKQDFAFTWKEKGTFVKPVGPLHWEIPASEFGTGGMDRMFAGYCSEPLVGIVTGHTYRYEIQRPEVPEAFNLPNDEAGRAEANRRATFVREMFGRYYPATQNSNDPDAAVAFQIALWEVINESQVPAVDAPNANAAPFDLFTGNYKANYPALEQSPSYVQRAQQYLKGLTGNDATFYENPTLADRELVRLKGLTSANGELAQSQFGLRANGGGGGVAGFNGATANGGGAAVGGGAGGFGPGGFGGLGGFGGPGIFTGGGGGSGSGNGSNGSTTTGTNTGTGGDNPSNTPGNNTPGNGGDNPNNNPNNTNPVPAPPAMVLGLIAVGLFAGRRAVHRFGTKA